LFQPRFQQEARQKFVLVFVDFPNSSAGKSRVKNPTRNARLKDEYDIEGFPSVIMADAKGRAYARDGYRNGGVQEYLRGIEGHQAVRTQRDQLLDAVENAQGLSKLRAAVRVVDFLSDKHVAHYYSALFTEFAELARSLDPANA